ncbi:hypothetical protein LL912_11330 [Niabella sp. CC-SYL272]|uniref:hypothetical protein n=1 Tax=Niabella agricola TaxID=2891571 RepID=UPI001F470035|nr:hypothetical protein [Niabella agricola]MCF3109368.1 hypothetical protein [Niabella agricola]
MKRFRTPAAVIAITFCFVACRQPEAPAAGPHKAVSGWRQQLKASLPLLGHRNWIIIADQAYPQLNAGGIEVIQTNEKLLPVLQQVLQQVNASAHVRPIIYRDRELQFITENQASGVTRFLQASGALFGNGLVQTILHDSIFKKMDDASRLFKILVLKTTETIPYSSVFLQLDCAYWDADREKELRANMENKQP